MSKLTPDLVLEAYRMGLFPMAETCHQPVQWYTADPRAIVPLDQRFHIPSTLQRRIRSGCYHITRDKAFAQVIQGCQAPTPKRPQTWINHDIIETYTALHQQGFAHSVEAWTDDGQLVGGLYGLSIAGAFFGESMFSTKTDASKVCLVHLVQHLRHQGYTLLDAQIGNDHMKQFGQIEIPLSTYMKRLQRALRQNVQWES